MFLHKHLTNLTVVLHITSRSIKILPNPFIMTLILKIQQRFDSKSASAPLRSLHLQSDIPPSTHLDVFVSIFQFLTIQQK